MNREFSESAEVNRLRSSPMRGRRTVRAHREVIPAEPEKCECEYDRHHPSRRARVGFATRTKPPHFRVGANAYGQGVTLIVQLVSTPALLAAFGVKTYGLWLIVSAFPNYIALADLGFSSAAANAITLSAARGEQDEARAIFQSTLALNLLTAAAILTLALGATALAPNSFIPSIPPTTRGEVREVCALQAAQVTATLCCGAILSGFISTGRYAFGVFLSSTARLTETTALVFGALALHSLVAAAALMLVARLCALVTTASFALRGAPWLRIGFQHARIARVRQLAGPALAVTALPIAFAVNLQGLILAIGATLSLEAVATFAATRTLHSGNPASGRARQHGDHAGSDARVWRRRPTTNPTPNSHQHQLGAGARRRGVGRDRVIWPGYHRGVDAWTRHAEFYADPRTGRRRLHSLRLAGPIKSGARCQSARTIHLLVSRRVDWRRIERHPGDKRPGAERRVAADAGR